MNLKAFQQFVLHGSPNKDDGLYPLPYNAYKGNNHVTESAKHIEGKPVTKEDDSGNSATLKNNDSAGNRIKTADFDQLSDEVDDLYAKHQSKKVQ